VPHRSRSALARVPLVVLLVGVGVGTWLGVTAAPATTSTLPPLPQLLRDTESAGTARFASEFSMSPPGAPSGTAGVGTIDFRTGAFEERSVGYSTETSQSGSAPPVVTRMRTIDEIIAVGGHLYDRSSSPGQPTGWQVTHFPTSASFGWIGLTAGAVPLPLAYGPEDVVRVVRRDSTVVGGVAVTRYDLTSTLKRGQCSWPVQFTPTKISLFVDGQGRLVLVRTELVFDLARLAGSVGAPLGFQQPFTERMTLRFSDFGAPVTIRPPRVTRHVAPGVSSTNVSRGSGTVTIPAFRTSGPATARPVAGFTLRPLADGTSSANVSRGSGSFICSKVKYGQLQPLTAGVGSTSFSRGSGS